MDPGAKPVLILGAGINGCALARELALNQVSVWIADTADIASGATSGSSRLIHGGLRYLEYGEFDLVKESLAERTRLLRLAPQFVHPLRLWIPATSRYGGAIPAVGRFFGWKWWPQPNRPRGSALVHAGLKFYDTYAQDATLPKATCGSSHVAGAPAVDHRKFARLCSYYDGQVTFPERLALSMLEDARRLSSERGLDFRVLNYRQARLQADTVEITPVESSGSGEVLSVQPSLIVNATGAWVDETLERLHIPAERLMGGTKGSHFFSFQPRLRKLLAGQGIYAEASDTRPIFITPLDGTVLIGTTDVPFEGPPETARATDAELEYLLASVNAILPEARLDPSDINFHYSAVRPLPYVHARTTGAITRRHFFVEHEKSKVPIFSVVGGKLTTMRSLAEQAAADVFKHWGRTPLSNSRERIFPGAENYPRDAQDLAQRQQQIAAQSGFSPASIATVWKLCGTRSEAILSTAQDHALLDGTDLPVHFARWSIREEHVERISDLVERRLMLLYHERLTRACLGKLASLLVEAERLPPADAEATADAEAERLKARYGKAVA